jgi:hypothetical protein
MWHSQVWVLLSILGFPNAQEHIIISLCPSPIIYYCLYLSIHVNSSNYILYFGFFGDDCQGNTHLTANEWILRHE